MSLNRRHMLTGAAALAASTAIPRAALADEPLSVGMVFISPIGDFGWSTMHNRGLEQMETTMGDAVTTTRAEMVAPPDFDRVVTQLVRGANCKLIFTTSFSYFQPTQRMAAQFPDVMFENATGTSTGPNLAVYNARFYEGRYVQGVIAAMKSKTKQIGYVASFPVPEVIHAINTVMRGAWSVDPEMKIRVVWISAWFNPGLEADAARALVDQGCDVLCAHTDSPAPLQLAEERGIFGFGQASDMTQFAPNAHLTSSVNMWGDYYASRAQAVIDGTWAPEDTWGGLGSGMFQLAPFTNMTPEETARAEAVVAGLSDGSIDPFAGPIVNQGGEEVIGAGASLSDDAIRAMNYFYQGIDVTMPS
jgi:simple sugar transport system substrate-binding protein